MFRRLSHELDEMLGQFGFEAPTFTPTTKEAIWAPRVEMLTKNGDLVVRAELPGIKKEDISIELTPEEIVLKGERKQEKEEHKEGFYRAERTYGSFYRALPLPEGASIDAAKASVKDGVLEVTMPVAKIAAKSRKLEIKEEAPVAAAPTKAA